MLRFFENSAIKRSFKRLHRRTLSQLLSNRPVSPLAPGAVSSNARALSNDIVAFEYNSNFVLKYAVVVGLQIVVFGLWGYQRMYPFLYPEEYARQLQDPKVQAYQLASTMDRDKRKQLDATNQDDSDSKPSGSGTIMRVVQGYFSWWSELIDQRHLAEALDIAVPFVTLAVCAAVTFRASRSQARKYPALITQLKNGSHAEFGFYNIFGQIRRVVVPIQDVVTKAGDPNVSSKLNRFPFWFQHELDKGMGMDPTTAMILHPKGKILDANALRDILTYEELQPVSPAETFSFHEHSVKKEV